MNTDIAKTLNSAQRSRLRLLTKEIRESTDKVLGNLATIHDESLWIEYGSFREYVEQELGFTRQRAHQILQEIKVKRLIAPPIATSTRVDIPVGGAVPTVQQIRTLAKLPDEKVPEAWETAIEVAKERGEQVTGAIVAEVVEEMREPDKSESPDYGKCPNCAGTKWTEDDDGVSCSKCHHPHGEPAGDVDEDRIKIQRSKTAKTVDALMRAFDDLNTMLPRPIHDEAIAGCKVLLKLAKGWK